MLNNPESLLFNERIRAVDPKHAFGFQLLAGDVDVHLGQPSEFADLSIGQRLTFRIFPQGREEFQS
jgi:hypothetical protein